VLDVHDAPSKGAERRCRQPKIVARRLIAIPWGEEYLQARSVTNPSLKPPPPERYPVAGFDLGGSKMLRGWTARVLIALPLASSPAVCSELGDLFKRVKDSVVVIETTEKDVDPVSDLGLINLEGMGSGVLISDDGKIVTASHVVQIADDISVRFPDGEIIPARYRSLATHMGLEGGTLNVKIGEMDFVLGGDIILECFGVSLADKNFREKIRAQVQELKNGDEILIRVLRGGQIVDLKQNFDPDLLIPAAP
jgi:S1-C subfamily serine protease